MTDQRDIEASEEARRRVAECWGRTAESRQESTQRGWLDSYPVAAERLNRPVGGAPDVHWLVGLCRRLGIGAESRWLSIGCGAAETEIGVAKEGIFGQLDAVDISKAALDKGSKLAEAAGVRNIRFREGDFHQLDIAKDAYDVVFMNMSLHHVQELDDLLGRIAGNLKRDGFLLLHEYIGPRQFQFTETQLTIVEELLDALPEELRRDVTNGEIKRFYPRQTVDYWNKVDPSEAIRSDAIVPTVERYFDVVERIDYGGTILHLLLEYIVHNFDPGDPNHLTLLRLLGRFEDVLLTRGWISSDFTVMAVRRKDAPPVDLQPIAGREAPELSSSSRAEIDYLRGELAEVRAYVEKIESSRSWRLLEGLRGLWGRKWRGV